MRMPCAVHGGAALSVALCPAHMPFPSIIISQSWDARKQQDPLINNQKTNGYQTESPVKKSPAARLSVTLLAQFPSQKWWMKSLSIVLAEYPLVQAHSGYKVRARCQALNVNLDFPSRGVTSGAPFLFDQVQPLCLEQPTTHPARSHLETSPPGARVIRNGKCLHLFNNIHASATYLRLTFRSD